MSPTDRIVTTATLRRFSEKGIASLSLPIGLIDRLEPHGMHVLVPRGLAPMAPPTMLCEAQLDTGDGEPTCMPVMVSRPVWRRLPTVFAVVSAATRLVPATVEAADLDPTAIDALNETAEEDDEEVAW